MTPHASPGGEPGRILLVDDDRDLVDILRLVLEQRGHTVLAAYNATDGLKLAEEQRPDLLILDVMMPDGTEGFHLVWKLRARPEPWFRQVPIIMLTAVHQRTPLRFYPDASDGTYAPGQYLEITEFLDKPVEPAELIRNVERVLATARRGPPLVT
jgi:two-component system alkaline phosphatase synthesis response regulator PhoP